jgi:hypothetical protein
LRPAPRRQPASTGVLSPSHRCWLCWLCTLVALLSSLSRTAAAQDKYQVLVLDPATPTPLERELSSRLKGELGAAGFDIVSLPLTAGADPERAVAIDGSELEAVAAFATASLSVDGAPPHLASNLRLWLYDRVVGVLMSRDGQGLEGSAAASLLAVQGVELLQARVTDWRWRQPARPEPVPAPPSPASPPLRAHAELTSALNVAVLWDSASGGVAPSPLLRLSYIAGAPRDGGAHVDFGARVSVAALGAATVLGTPARHVDVTQSFALLEGVVVVDPGSWLRPFGALGAGAYRVSVEGVTNGPAVGRSEDTGSPIAGLGVGLDVRPFGPVMAVLEAQGLFALRGTAVENDTARIATFGRPLLVFSAGLGVAW